MVMVTTYHRNFAADKYSFILGDHIKLYDQSLLTNDQISICF
jgi:hypothetical protein